MSVAKLSVDKGIATIVLSRPEKKNAINPELVSVLSTMFTSLLNESKLKLVVLTGAGDTFSAGADLGHIQQLAENSFDENVADSTSLKNLFYQIYSFPKPVIAKVNGHAIAGGAGLASVCDVVLMKKTAKIGYTEVKIGFIAAIVLVFLNQIIGEKTAKDLLLSGRLLEAEEAMSIGLVSKVFEDIGFDQSCQNYIEKFILNSTEAQVATKHFFNSIVNMNIQEALEEAVIQNAKTRSSADCKEGIAAFLGKRKPRWQEMS
jgi:methylglutaconyl-CoA hydratase